MKIQSRNYALAIGLALAFTNAVIASDIGMPDAKVLKGLYPGKTYSPYAQRAFPANVYWSAAEKLYLSC